MTEAEKLLRELIALPSVNPAYLPESSPYANEQRVAEFLADSAGKSGFDAELRPVLPGRPNLFIRFSPAGQTRQRVILAPHMDTVGGADLPGNLFTPRVKVNRLYGRGACDTKGSMAIMLTALKELAKAGKRPQHTEILFAGLIDEECFQAGSRALVTSKLKADLAIVGEPTRLKIATAHKGVLWMRLTTRGKAAHGSHPELGCSAVHAMARIIDALETKYASRLRTKNHSLLGPGSINVGAVRGGIQPNIVPAECTALLDRRTLPGETDSQVLKELQSFIARHVLLLKSSKILQSASEAFSLRVTLAPSRDFLPQTMAGMKKLQAPPCLALETDTKLSLVQTFFSCAGQKGAEGVDFFSDAGVLSQGGIPSVVFGPGNIAQAHKPDEWVSLRHLEQGQALLLRFLRSLS